MSALDQPPAPASSPAPPSARAEPSTREVRVLEVTGGEGRRRGDRLAVEEPLEIVLAAGGSNDRVERRTVAITMRTPGHDRELAAGFLHGEGLIRRRELMTALVPEQGVVDPRQEGPEEDGEPSARPGDGPPPRRDQLVVHLAARRLPALTGLDRHVFTSSACGVCGRTALDERLLEGVRPAAGALTVPAEVLYRLPRALREAQATFEATGGLHAAGLFDAAGELLSVREDVGRHNALDKLLGAELLAGRLSPESPLENRLVLVSGRASFELVQKCAAAGVPLLAAVSAPSSLAVEVAERVGMTLVAFLRERRFNVYSGAQRIRTGS